MVHLTCENCGEGFSAPASRQRFCSICCKGIASRGKPLKGTDAERLWARVEKTNGCWNWTGPVMRSGYGHIGLLNRKTISTHRLAYQLTRGAIPPGAFVLHSCDNRRCCNPAHLRLGNVQDNADDMTIRQRQARGERHGHAKLTEYDVRSIRLELGQAMRGQTPPATYAEVGKRYGVSERTIREIRDRLIWTWLN